MANATTETVFLDRPDSRITSARAVLGGVTYPMANVTSVRVVAVKDDPVPAIAVALTTGFIGFVLLRCAGQPELSLLAAGFAVAIIGYILSQVRTTHVVILGAAGGETHAYASFSEAECRSVAEAITNAIVARG